MTTNPHAPLPLGVVSLITWLSGLQPVLASVLTLLTIGWYISLFVEKYRKPKK